MILKKSIALLIAFYCLTVVQNIFPQTFGFGCLGFVGGYGGYSYQEFDAKGLNDYVSTYNLDNKDSLSSPMRKFGKAQGYRVGINFFRANIKGFILTTKGFYQALNEKNSASMITAQGTSNSTYQLNLTNWGLGLDLGTSIVGGLSWKVIDAAVLFNTVTFTNTLNLPGPTTVIKKYNNEKYVLGYSVGTGFILDIIEQYVSIEGLAGYTFFSIDKMKADDSAAEMPAVENSNQPMRNFIASGGFNAVIQLNVGFPL